MKSFLLENGMYLGISYFTDVKNINILKENALTIYGDRSPVLIRTKFIYDPFQIVVATNNAYLSNKNCCMKTKSLATEILYNLSSSKKISESLNDIGADDQDNDIIVALVSKFSNVPEMKIFHEICIGGNELDLLKVSEKNDENFIKSYYGINEIETVNSTILDSIVSRIACKTLI